MKRIHLPLLLFMTILSYSGWSQEKANDPSFIKVLVSEWDDFLHSHAISMPDRCPKGIEEIPLKIKSNIDRMWNNSFMSFQRIMSKRFFYDFYDTEKVLFLSDGSGNGQYSFADQVAKKVPWSAVFKTDYNIKETETDGNRINLHLDNTQKFPFADNFFDMIIMERGLCVCDFKEKTCCGIKTQEEEMTQLLSEIARVFNKRNPRGQVILHGNDGIGGGIAGANKKIIELWKNAADEVMKLNPELQVDLVFDLGEHFLGIRFYAKKQ